MEYHIQIGVVLQFNDLIFSHSEIK